MASQGYIVDTAQLSFDIVVTVQSNTSATAEALHLGPTEPFSSTLDGQVNVQLLGDLSTYKSMPDFSSYYLMIPSPTGVLTLYSQAVRLFLSKRDSLPVEAHSNNVYKLGCIHPACDDMQMV